MPGPGLLRKDRWGEGGALACVAGGDVIGRAGPRNRESAGYACVNPTLHGHPVAAAAGLATLEAISERGFHERLNARARPFRSRVQGALEGAGLPPRVAGDPSLWQRLFMDREPRSRMDVLASDLERSAARDPVLLEHGVWVLPNVRRFVCAVHTQGDLDDTERPLEAACGSLR